MMRVRNLLTWSWLAALVLAPRPGHAQHQAFTLKPLNAEVAAPAGKSQSGAITLSRGAAPEGVTARPVRLRAYVLDWTLDRKGDPNFTRPGTVPGSCSAWVQVSPAEFTLAAGETREVRYTITVPPDAHGTYHTAVMVESEPVSARVDGQRTAAVNGRIGSILYVQVGPQTKRARVATFSVAADHALVSVENTGISHIRVKGVLQFHDAAGKQVEQVELRGGVVLPTVNNFRDLTVETPQLPAGTYQATVILDYGGEALVGARTHVTIP